jgi:FkbM family methyltransferase
MHLQNIIKNQKSIPKFFDLNSLISSSDKELINFYTFIFNNKNISHSQLFQDLFVIYLLGMKREGKYLEFGATNGIELSNSLLLEKEFGWSGVLAEPSPQWKAQLKENRPKSQLLDECIYSETGKSINFFVSNFGIFSTIEEFRDSDIESMPGNTKVRNEDGYSVKVPTISLNDVFIKYFNGERIDYMSVDTEGSEFLILSNFNFDKYGPKVVTVEHNFTSLEKKLDALFKENKYRRMFAKHTQFDAWYVRED